MTEAAPEAPAPSRRIVHADALTWLAETPADPRASVITSLPDVSELPEHDLASYRAWFDATAQRVIGWVPSSQVAIFFQSDVCAEGLWLDKGYLVMRAAEAQGASLLWHKIVCRKAPGTVVHGRASYSHLVCVSRGLRARPQRSLPDVLGDAGHKPWSKAMGVSACALACRFVRDETDATVVVDPFCGHGTALAVANALGLDALGVDRSARQCRAARKLRISSREARSLGSHSGAKDDAEG
jgi:hypothetical protein